ncbi:MAG: thioredoxin [Planctomycetes bacterium]|nr:thioredoxin [Planctomycetota bacterium]
MGKVLELNDSTFQKELQGSTVPVLVDFSASWCQPCKALAPTIDAVADEYQGKLKVFKVDIDHSPDTTANFGIQSVPTCIFFKGGVEVDRFIGNLDLRSVKARVTKVVG